MDTKKITVNQVWLTCDPSTWEAEQNDYKFNLQRDPVSKHNKRTVKTVVVILFFCGHSSLFPF